MNERIIDTKQIRLLISLILISIMILMLYDRFNFVNSVYLNDKIALILIGSIFVYAVLIHTYFRRSVYIDINPLDVALLIIVCYSIFFNVASFSKINKYYLIFLFISYMFIKIFVKNNCEKKNLDFLYDFLLIATIPCTISIINILVGSGFSFIDRNLGLYYGFINIDHFSGYVVLNVSIWISSFLYFRNKTNIKSKLLTNITLALSILGTIIIVLMGSRSGILALSFIGLYYMYKSQLISGLSKRNQLILLCTICLVLVGTLFYLRPESALGRLLIWKVTLIIIFEGKILLGNGAGSFKINYNLGQGDYFKLNKEYLHSSEIYLAGNVQQAHNEFLQFIYEYGLVLFLLVSVTFGYILVRIIKSKSNYKTYLSAPLLTIITISLFSFPFQIPQTLVLITIVLSTISIVIDFRIKCYFRIKNYFSKRIIICLFVIINSIILIKTSTRVTFINQKEKMQLLFYGGEYLSSIDGFKKIYPKFKSDGEFLFNYGSALYKTGNYEEAIHNFENAAVYNSDPNLYFMLGQVNENFSISKAKEYYLTTHYMIPHKILPLYKLFMISYELNDKVGMNEFHSKISLIDDKIPTLAAKEMRKEVDNIFFSMID